MNKKSVLKKKVYTEDGKMFVTQKDKIDSDYQDIYIGRVRDGKHHAHLGITKNQKLKFVQSCRIIKMVKRKADGKETVEFENLENGKVTKTIRSTTNLK